MMTSFQLVMGFRALDRRRLTVWRRAAASFAIPESALLGEHFARATRAFKLEALREEGMAVRG